MTTERVKVAVLGGGPAGSATALRLGQLGVSNVLLAEASCFEAERIGESLPPDTRKLLGRLGVLEPFLAEGHETCAGSCSSWGNRELGWNDFLVHPYGRGWHLDRRRFDAFLARQAEKQGARLRKGWCFRSARRIANGFRLRFQTDAGARRVEAQVVVDATGARARFARRLGIERVVDDRLVTLAAVFSKVDLERLGAYTLLESTPYGWWYAARLPRGRAMVAVTTDSKNCKERDLRNPRSWLCHLAETDHLSSRLLRAWGPSDFAPHAALTSRLSCSGGASWLAVGDAAWTSDPLAAQGIHRALASGLAAGDVIVQRLRGEIESLAVHGERWNLGYGAFLRLREHLYAQEQRWPDESFWSARRGARA